MFELAILRSLLWPRRGGRGSATLALLASFVIALVVWLVVAFFSVTEGLENNWVKRVVALHGVIRIFPHQDITYDQDPGWLTEAWSDVATTDGVVAEVRTLLTQLQLVAVPYLAAPATLKLCGRDFCVTQPVVAVSWSDENQAMRQLLTEPPDWRVPRVSQLFPMLLPQAFQGAGIERGDQGVLLYSSLGAGGVVERQLMAQADGFYDAGVLSVGGRIIFMPLAAVKRLSGASTMAGGVPLEGLLLQNIPLQDAEAIKQKLLQRLPEGWGVESFRDLHFAKELLQQFASDRLLFSLLSLIIMAVASANIVSFLVIMVYERRHEIGILRAMGATASSLAMIFGGAGLILGVTGAAIGTIFGVLTLTYLEQVIAFLSFLQGHPAFQASFFGGKLPNEISTSALCFVWLAAPVLATLSGVLPALRSSRLKPAEILRNR